MKVPVVENVLKLNDEIAMQNRLKFDQAGVYVVDLIGAPGCGKTALLEATLEKLSGILEIGVLAGDPATSRDGDRLAKYCDNVVQINTGNGCHLDANQVRQAITRLDLKSLDVLFIENVGNLICPVGFDLGQHVKIGMFSVCQGDDKAAKHPHVSLVAGALLLNKTDLLQYIPFNLPQFRSDVAHLNAAAPLLEISVRENHIAPWLNWLTHNSLQKRQRCTISPTVEG